MALALAGASHHLTLPPAWPSKLAATGIVAAGAWGGWGYLRSLNLKPIRRGLACAGLPDQVPLYTPRPGQPCLSLSLAWGLLLGPIACRYHPEPRRRRCRALPVPVGPQPGRVELSQSKHYADIAITVLSSRCMQQLQLDQSHKLKRTVSPGLVTPRLPPYHRLRPIASWAQDDRSRSSMPSMGSTWPRW